MHPTADLPDERKALMEHFDADYYLAANPDIKVAGIDPLLHFQTVGWHEGRNPSRAFDVNYYLAANPDVAVAGINPLLHFASSGEREGRLPRRPLDDLRRVLDASKEPHRKAVDWAEIADQSSPMTSAALKSALDSTVGSIGLILSISHDDYHDSCGGVQNLITDERNAFTRAGWRYLHISPASPLPTIATDAETFRVVLRLDTERLGVARFTDLASAIATLRHHYRRVELIVHHFMGHAPELLLKLAKLIGVRPIVWIHDFFSLCPSYALMRNDVAYCAAPAPGSGACGICVYGTDRIVHLHRIRNFFEASRPIVIAPSQGTLDFWKQRGELPCSEAIVLPLARLVMSQDGSLKVKGDLQRALRVAHLGGRTLYKGWPIFEELAVRHRGDSRYKFYQLGVPPDWAADSNVQQISVRVESASRKAMIEAIAECRIDVVVCWSLCRETFCYTVHEALSGGAFVVARRAAGNVWPSIEKNAPNQGCAVENKAELFALFETGALQAFAVERSRGVLIPGGGTADLLLQRSVTTTIQGLTG